MNKDADLRQAGLYWARTRIWRVAGDALILALILVMIVLAARVSVGGLLYAFAAGGGVICVLFCVVAAVRLTCLRAGMVVARGRWEVKATDDELRLRGGPIEVCANGSDVSGGRYLFRDPAWDNSTLVDDVLLVDVGDDVLLIPGSAIGFSEALSWVERRGAVSRLEMREWGKVVAVD